MKAPTVPPSREPAELAAALDVLASSFDDWPGHEPKALCLRAAALLRQQADRIAALTATQGQLELRAEAAEARAARLGARIGAVRKLANRYPMFDDLVPAEEIRRATWTRASPKWCCG
jgi:acyl-CoA reductase-like NAD-dependent aldehyde dehydrogenase